MTIVAEIRAEIALLEQKLAEIQDACSHPTRAVLREAGASTGNYDPAADGYWYDCHCLLCDKRWREEQ